MSMWYEKFPREWFLSVAFLGAILIGSATVQAADFDIEPGPFSPSWNSLREQYQCPEWFRDAKFGVYMHWGLNSVPGYDGHYARYMYRQHAPENLKGTGFKPGREKVYQYHVETFGHPSKFGYKDFIPLLTADKFDADKLTQLYKDCGARYIGVMAVHHDNFDLYDSTHQPWNSVRMGPKLDIVGAWKEACKKHGLRFAISSHLSNGFHEHVFYQGETDTTGPLAGVPYDTVDPSNEGLYGKRTADRKKRTNDFVESWYLRTKELIDKYDPDLLYFDGKLVHAEYGLNIAAHFYNKSYAKNGGKLDSVLTIKDKKIDLAGVTVDMEKGQAAGLVSKPWQTDTTINDGWFHLGGPNDQHKPSDQLIRLTGGVVVDNLIDIVSKNGNMMLNVGLRADGSLPEAYETHLRQVGDWLAVNGEAIFETRPWTVFGEGPTSVGKGAGFNERVDPMSAKDIRFTTKKGTLYAHLLDWPGDSSVATVKSLGVNANDHDENEIATVSMLATGETLKWTRDEKGLHVVMPSEKPGDFAFVLKIQWK